MLNFLLNYLSILIMILCLWVKRMCVSIFKILIEESRERDLQRLQRFIKM